MNYKKSIVLLLMACGLAAGAQAGDYYTKAQIDADQGHSLAVSESAEFDISYDEYKEERTKPFDGGKSMTYGLQLKLIVPEALKNLDGYTQPSYSGDGTTIPVVGGKKGSYRFRVWRIVDGNETLLNDLQDTEQKDGDGAVLWYTSYKNLEQLEPSDDLFFRDLFVSSALKSGEAKNVKYLIRMYYWKQELNGRPEDSFAPRRHTPARAQSGDASSSLDNCEFYVVETELNIDYSNTVVTAVTGIDVAAEAQSVTYCNMQGLTSPTPFPGLNIKVTRYLDGTLRTEKLLVP